MEGMNAEKDCGLLGNLFQSVVNEMRGSTPLWEDFTYKSMKLHSSLKTTVSAIGAFLEAFQKVADMAASSKGATREIGSALTRLCMRHRSIESHLKVLTSSVLENLVAPLQEKLEDWKKAVALIDKDHAKEYKKAKQEIKKSASDTMRLQKKVKKGGGHGKSEMQHKLECSMAEVNAKYTHLEEAEKHALRQALIEERSRFCHFITCLKPFVDSEVKLLSEISHVNEIMDGLCMQAGDPSVLPATSEQVILDLKGVDHSAWNPGQQSPPSSPSSLGSRKSSMCSINSIGSSNSSHSPSHSMHKRTTSQQPLMALRLTSVSSQDSGFTSQDTLFLRPNTPQSLNLWQSSATDVLDEGSCDSTPTTPSDHTPSASSTWNNWPNLPQARPEAARPHTISSAYEKGGHSRPALKANMFEPPQESVELRPKVLRSLSQSSNGSGSSSSSHRGTSATITKSQPVLPPHCPKPRVKAVAPPCIPSIPSDVVYANMADLQAQSGGMFPDDGDPTTPTTSAGGAEPQRERASVARPPPQGMIDLQAAIAQMDIFTAALKVDSPGETTSEEVTPRASMDLHGGHDLGTSDSRLVEIARPKIQQNTSDELAKAIRELEASTAALTSAYDPTPVPNSAPNGTNDSDSYTSKGSLPCSSGYGTMASTPAGSEDTISSSGDCCMASTDTVDTENDKYYTIPRSGEANMAYRKAMQAHQHAHQQAHPQAHQHAHQQAHPQAHPQAHQRPASTSGIPAPPGGTSLVRHHTVKAAKPPPPVRRTASVSGNAPVHVQKLRSPPRQMSMDDAGGQSDGAYAELTLIQQSIHGPGARQPASPTTHPAVPSNPPPASTATVIQSLNAQFATLNSQYQGEGELDGNTTRKSAPPAVRQKPVRSPDVAHHDVAHQHHNSMHQQGGVRHSHHPAPQPHPNTPRPLHHGKSWHGGQNPYQQQIQQHLQHQPQQESHYAVGNTNIQTDPQHQTHHQNNQHHHHHVPSSEEDFLPPPPSAEDLQEIERIYSCPPPIGPSVQAPSAHAPQGHNVQSSQSQHYAQGRGIQGQSQQYAQPSQGQGGVQASLLKELKRKVSIEEDSEA